MEEPAKGLEYLCETLPETLVLCKLGRDGCIAGKGNLRWKKGIYDVEAIDTVGAGDAFVGV